MTSTVPSQLFPTNITSCGAGRPGSAAAADRVTGTIAAVTGTATRARRTGIDINVGFVDSGRAATAGRRAAAVGQVAGEVPDEDGLEAVLEVTRRLHHPARRRQRREEVGGVGGPAVPGDGLAHLGL